MSITEKQKRWLKQQAHHLKPVVIVGQHGITDAVIAELEIALDHHELLKTKISAGDRELRDAAIAELIERTGAMLVNRIGNIAILYRANPRKRDPLALPRI
ncbi:ribosome assembly RNA-binding protein YhbY [Marichromatium gracile]|uniref:RNA-binding protein n=1 Tax=Marichromatium purpuratum 984 TaxID=765910 RepID=W0DZ35_MARPU|nr:MULTISPECIES: ribosome assembly RNA-binding protein YhbY [Marichromatium]AHF03880.1 RNA-binding protein [Marichromatium purpuratum 984]MCF1183522.1 ribosome assembly RNA-binding protein YhbY [Marichromatium gracile]